MHAVASLAVVVCLAWPSAQQAREAANDVLSDDAYQRELPVDKEVSASTGNAGNRPRWGGGGSGSPSVAGPVAGGVADLVTTLVWVVVILVLVAILFVFFREWQGGRDHKQRRAEDEDDEMAPEVHLDARALGDAQALAREGRFVEAIHVLLLRTFEAIGRNASLPRSLTSREVLGRVAMSESAHGALSELVVAVEVSHFGGQDADEADYQRCVDRYRAVLDAHGVVAS